MLALSIPSEWSVPESPRFSMSPPQVPCSFQRCANRAQRHRNVSIVFNEFSIRTGQAQEASDVLTILRLRPINHRMSLMLLGMDAVLVNVKAAKINFLTSCYG